MKESILCFTIFLFPCLSTGEEDKSLKDALTFHASFDGKVDADFAKGDGTFYTTVAKKTEAGLKVTEKDILHEKGKGRFGDCLNFRSIETPRVHFAAKDNVVFSGNDWKGTVSFWLRTSPDGDLAPGYTDPIQITPKSALDACLFFEFGIEDPRPCRLGVFGDKESWNPEGKPNKEIALTDRPLITVLEHPFSRDRWTHVVFTWKGFNSSDSSGVAKLYLDGALRGDLTGWPQQYSWDLDETKMNLGVKFIGGLDELSCFNRELSGGEVKALHELKNGVASLLQ